MVNMIGIPASILHLEKSKELLEQVARGPVEVGQLHEIFQVDVNCFAVSIYSKKFPLCFALFTISWASHQVLAQTCLTHEVSTILVPVMSFYNCSCFIRHHTPCAKLIWKQIFTKELVILP